MILGKRTTVFSPKACYMLFGLDENFNYNDMDEEEETLGEMPEVYFPNTIMFNGSIRIFPSLRELNEHLAQERATDETANNIEKKLYKGHIFPAKEFPLETENKKNITFIIENISGKTCFVEQITSLDSAAKSIEEEINMLLQQGNTDRLETSEIVDYMIFHGKPMPLSYYCYDSDV